MKQRKNMRLLSVLLSLVLVVGLLPGLAMQAAAAGPYEFGYAYDCQRSPAFPRQGQSFTASGIANPKAADGSTIPDAAGSWLLTSRGYYYSGIGDTFTFPHTYLDAVISNIAGSYGIQPSQVEVYELTKNDVHVAYGAIFARTNNTNAITTFLGDNWNTGGCTYLLSKEPLSGSVTVTIDQDVTTIAPPAHAHVWHAETTGNGTLEAKATIKCTGCDAAMDVSLTAANVTLPGDVFCAQISPAPNARAASPLSVSATPGYKYSADGSNFEDINNPQTFTPKPGIYQASIVVSEGNAQVENLYVKYTVSDPAVTAATGDNRPIALMLVGLTAFATMAAVAFLLDSRRRARF